MGKSSKKSGKQSKKQLQKKIQAILKDANAQQNPLLDKLPSTFLSIPLKSTTREVDTDGDTSDQHENEDATTNDNGNNNTNYDNNVATIQYIALASFKIA